MDINDLRHTNAANTQNIEVMGWTYDYGEEDVVDYSPPHLSARRMVTER